MKIANRSLAGPALLLGIWLGSVSPCLGADTGSPAQANNGHVTFCGTVVPLVEVSCIGVKSRMPGQPTYDISSAKPKPTIGELISGSGQVSHNPNFCMQGPALDNIVWKKADACPMGPKGK